VTQGAEKSDWASTVTDPMTPIPLRVISRTRELADTFSLGLEPAAGMEGFGFTPGQFNMLYPFGVGEAPISISGDPVDTGTLVHRPWKGWNRASLWAYAAPSARAGRCRQRRATTW
jgi:hypothetical protein